MSTETPTRPTETATPGRRFPLLWVLALIAALAVGVVVGWLVFGGETVESTVTAEIEQEINALIDDWMTVWNDGDGDLAMSLFTADGRYVGGRSGLDGWSGEDLKAGIERFGGSPYVAERIGSPLIIDRTDAYYVAARYRPYEFSEEYFVLFNIVDEQGSLKIRYTDDWMALGWFRLADDLPYEPVNVD